MNTFSASLSPSASLFSLPRCLAYLVLILASFQLTGCGYNDIQRKDEQVRSAWSEVLNQYQRRADLVPNLVSTVKAYAAHEQEVFQTVTEARAKVGSINVDAKSLDDPEAMAKFQQAQAGMSSALSRLLVVSENYPQLKANENFLSLQTQLEGTENRITVARNRFIKAVEDYNVGIRVFPSNITSMIFGYKPKNNFTVQNETEISKAPKVNF